ncbi:MAG TPA: TetR family transcriptional regulator [Porticoccaceae bacterium]|nr:TetR family transcriptional regulator [Porticoccaceae bacterium]HCO61032.1 TetR family transcriptional regulator [Porticoccaceae bacterium]
MTKTNTKQRIANTTLELFNNQGVPNVSTNHIALELDISPGNLYYHFKSKDALIELLFSAYEQELTTLFENPFEPTSTIEDAWFFLHLGFEIATRYRFVYQDTEYILGKCRTLSPRFRRILHRYFDALLGLLITLSDQHVLQNCAESVLEELALNMLLVASQWISFKQHLSGEVAISPSESDLSQGIYQVLSLLSPYLDVKNQDHLRTLQQAYA